MPELRQHAHPADGRCACGRHAAVPRNAHGGHLRWAVRSRQQPGLQSTALAQHCAPPAPPSPLPFIMRGLVERRSSRYMSMTARCWHVRVCPFGGPDLQLEASGSRLGVIALGWLLMKGWRTQAKAYSAAKRQWQRTWFCHAWSGAPAGLTASNGYRNYGNYRNRPMSLRHSPEPRGANAKGLASTGTSAQVVQHPP
jgi:hypothetical protein